jgi:hypothetical protein
MNNTNNTNTGEHRRFIETVDPSICVSYLSWPATKPCSGHGTCQSDATCICDSNWNGRSEYQDRSGLDCNINQDWMLTLNVIGFLLSIILLMECFLLLYKRYKHLLKSWLMSANNAQQRSWTTTECMKMMLSEPSMRVAFYSLAYSISAIIWYGEHVSHPNGGGEQVSNWTTTLAGIGNAAFFWVSSSSFVWFLVRSSTLAIVHQGGQTGADLQLSRMRIAVWSGRIFGTISAFTQLAMRIHHSHGNLDGQRRWSVVYMSTAAMSGGWVLLTAIYFGHRLISIMDSLTSEDERIVITKKRLQQFIRLISIATACILWMFAQPIWPWLMTYSAWLSPAMWMTATLTSMLPLLLFLNNTDTTDSVYSVDDSNIAKAAAAAVLQAVNTSPRLLPLQVAWAAPAVSTASLETLPSPTGTTTHDQNYRQQQYRQGAGRAASAPHLGVINTGVGAGRSSPGGLSPSPQPRFAFLTTSMSPQHGGSSNGRFVSSATPSAPPTSPHPHSPV